MYGPRLVGDVIKPLETIPVLLLCHKVAKQEGVGLLTVIQATSLQPVASVIVRQYIPLAGLLREDVVAPLLQR